MQLMILENRRLRTTMRVTAGVISIGSSPECGICLPDPKLGLHQASIAQDSDGVWWLEVVDPTVPISLNRTVQKTRAKLRHADEIELGAFAIRLFMESEKSRDEIQRERMVELTRRHGLTLPLGTIVRKSEDAMTVRKEDLEQTTLLALRLEQSPSVQDLLSPILRAVLRTCDGRRAWLAIRRDDTAGDFDWALAVNAKGEICDRPLFSTKMQARVMASTQYLCCPQAPADGVRSAMAVPLLGQRGNMGMIYVENDAADPPFTDASLNMLSAISTCIALPVENVLRMSASKQRAVMSTQQTIARATQDSMTPHALPVWEDLHVAAYRFMGLRRCCDLYDIVQLRDKTAAIIIARLNVDENNLPRYFAEVRTMFRAAALYSEAPHLFVRALNWLIFEGSTGGQSIDVAVAWVDPANGKVQCCLAGGGVRLGRIRADGTCGVTDARGAPAVGQTRSAAYESVAFALAEGDGAFLATTGYDTAKNIKGEVFGLKGLQESLCDGVGSAPGQVLSEFAADLAEFTAGGVCTDDSTVVLASWK
jgi:hypothetical protein